MSAVGARRRHFLRVEDVVENIGIVVRAHPAKRVELKASVRDVGIKRGEFKRPQLERDSDALPLIGQRFGQKPRGFIRGSFQRQMQSHAVRPGGNPAASSSCCARAGS